MSKKEEIYKDERFAHLLKNPRFKTIPKKEAKVKIDDRFKPMFENEKFSIQYNVDKYGRKVNKKSAENLKNYYDLGSSESSDEEEEEEKTEESDLIPGNAKIKGGNKMPEILKNKLKDMEVDYIRGEGILQSDSSDEESSEDDEVTIEHNWGELDRDAETTDESTRRIACMHMDWDRIRAVDIMVLCNSFIPAGAGSILSVKIYPSEFGKQRMAEEELKGPKEITSIQVDSEEGPVDEEDETYVEKLREYQLNRLKYYYAVVEFDSVKCADIVYKECDGLEYESTSNRLDLRFIPDDMEFDDEPKDSCFELPELSKYEPRIFFTSALQHAKVELTWDETDISRKEVSEKLFSERSKEISDRDLRKYVAFSSESENEDESEANTSDDELKESKTNGKSKIDLYKSLLDEINQKENEKKKRQVEMEYSWGVGGSSKKLSSDEKSEEEDDKNLTPFEKLLEKKKQKKKLKKESRKKQLQGDDDDNQENGYSSSDFNDIDMNDPYFAEEFANDEYKMPSRKGKKKATDKSKNDSDDEEKVNAQKALELLLHDDKDEKSHFSLKKIQESEDMNSKKKKRKLKKMKKKGINNIEEEVEDNFKINIQDDRFSAVFSQPEFNIDPTDPGFKKTKGMEKIIEEKIKRRHNIDESSSIPEKKQKIKDTSLKMLVKSIKRKVEK